MPLEILEQSLHNMNENRSSSAPDEVHCDCADKSDPPDFAARLHAMATRNLDAIAADLDDVSADPDACERRARALATVTLALDEIARVRHVQSLLIAVSVRSEIDPDLDRDRTRVTLADADQDWVVDEDDPRACPRDLAALRATLATRLDGIGEKKNISNL